MENQNQNTSVPISGSRGYNAAAAFDVPQTSAATPVMAEFSPASSKEPLGSSQPTSPPATKPQRPRPPRGRRALWLTTGIILSFVAVGAAIFFWGNGGQQLSQISSQGAGRFGTLSLRLAELDNAGAIFVNSSRTLSVNGQLKVNGAVVITPSAQPTSPVSGQIYYDQGSNVLSYYNGTQFINLPGNSQVVTSLGGADGTITLGSGLTLSAGQLRANGIVSFTSASTTLGVSNDGNGNITLTDNRSPNGVSAVQSSGGTVGRIPVFNGAQTITDSLLSQTSTNVDVGGTLSVADTINLQSVATATLNLSSATNGVTGQIYNDGNLHVTGGQNNLWLDAGGSGTVFINAANGNPVAINEASIPAYPLEVNGDVNITTGHSYRIGGTVICDITGCTGAGGGSVTSLDGLNGALTLANSTGSGTTITIDDASTSAKGIAQFNSTNFNVSSGVVNTIQDIATTASPTFAGINTNGISPSGALTVGATTQNLTLQGATTTITSTSGAFAAGLTFAAPTANVTYRLQTAAAGTYDVCTTAGNCVGVGGSVSTSGGSANVIPKYTGTNSIGPSLLTDNGTLVTVGGDLSVTGTLSLTNALAVTSGGTGAATASGARTNLGAAASGANSDITSLSGLTTALSVLQGGTGATSLTANGVLLGNGTSAISSLAAISGGQCLVSTAGAPVWQTCPGSGGVSSLDSLTGAITIANSSGAGGTVTIDNASSSAKGIAQFNSTNFNVSSGVVNTIQDINTTAAPTFGQLTLTSSQASTAMLTVNNTNVSAVGNLIDLQINGGSKFAVTPAGALSLSSTINGQTISSSANFTGSLAVTGVANLNGGANVTGTLSAGTVATSTLTPSSALTVGATAQSFTLQGNASSTLTATNSGNATTLAFQTPTANVTYRFLTTSAGTYDVCTTAGNCSGVGGGVTTLGGTTNKIAKFTAAQTIADSIITDNGSTVTIGGTLSTNVLTPTSALSIGATGQNLTLQGATVQLTSTSSGVINSLTFATPSSGNKTITIPNVTGTVCLDSGNCLGGGGGGANTALSNLTGVAINTALLPGTAGTINLGSATLPFGDLYMAGTSTTPATNNFQITGASTGGTRTITLPDASGTVCLQNATSCGFAASSGSNSYIRNGTSVQSANFYVQNAGGTGVDTAVLQQSSGQTGKILRILDSAGTTDLFAVGASSFAVNTTMAGNSGTANAITSNISPVSALINGNWLRTVVSPSSTASGLIVGNSITLDTGNNASYTANLVANLGQVNWSTTGTSTSGNVTGTVGKVAASTGSGAISNAIGVQAEGQFQGGAVTNYYGLYSTMNANTNVAVQNAYGLKIDDFAATGGTAPTNFYAIATDGGQVRLRSNSATGFQIQNSSTTPLLTVDTSAGNLYVGNTSADSTGNLLVLDTKNTSGDPTGINGGLYYNSNSNKFRCYQNSGWTDCITSATTTLQNAYDNSSPATMTLASGKDLTIAATDQATDPNVLIDLQCDTSCSTNGRFAVQDDGTDVFKISPAGGAVLLKNSVNSNAAFEVQNAAGTTSLISVNTNNGRVAIGTSTSGAGSVLVVGGAIDLSGSQTTLFTTPGGPGGTPPPANLPTKINIPIYAVGGASQVIALGLTSSSQDNARGILVADARTAAHQASISVLSPDETDVYGLSWDGSSGTAYLKAEAASIGIRSGSKDVAQFLNNSNVGIGLTGSSITARLTVGDGTPPGPATGSGTAATEIMKVIGGKGGTTTGNTGQTGGTGAVIELFGGDGGDAPSGSTNGNGGSITLQGGAPGAGAGTAGTYGNLFLQSTGGKVRIGSATAPGFPLDVTGDISTSTGYRAAGSAGTSATCSGGQFFQNQVVVGGIVTNGTCAASSGGSLQQAYTNSTGGTTPEVKLDSTRGGYDVQDADSTIGAGSLFAVRASNASGLGASLFSTSNTEVQIGSATTDTSQILLRVDSFSTYADTASCATNPGAIYYNTSTNALRSCVDSSWRDVVTSGEMGIMLFGVVPDSGPTPGDLISKTTPAASSGPCKVFNGSAAKTIRWTGCTIYTGGRRQVVAAQTSDVSVTGTANQFQHLCIFTAGNAPSLGTAGNSENVNLPTFSATAPAACLATVKVNSGNTGLGAIYDTRTFTTTTKTFGTLANGVSVGWMVKLSTNTGIYDRTTAATDKVYGVVVSTAGGSGNAADAIIATSGPANVKIIGAPTNNAVDSYIIPSTTTGYGNLTTTAQTNPYTTAGLTQNATSSASTCTASGSLVTDDCRGSAFTILNIR